MLVLKIHVLSQALVYWLTIFACNSVLFYNLEKKKIREKLDTSLHYYLLFAIHIYFWDFFLDFSRRLNSTDNNLRDISCGLNLTNRKFLWYFVWITFCGNISNLRNPQNRIRAKINTLKLLGNFFEALGLAQLLMKVVFDYIDFSL